MKLGDLQQRTLERAGETTTGGFYTPAQAVAALNQAQRLFCFMTLCLETTAQLALIANQQFYHVLPIFPNWFAPLRLRVAGTGGGKVLPATLADFDALNMNWQGSIGTPNRYACLGFDFLVFDQAPDVAGVTLDVTFAYGPPPLVLPIDVPAIPEQYHASLMDWAVPRLRAQEGGQEFSKNLPSVQLFFSAAQKLAGYVRARNVAHHYDTLPFELAIAKIGGA